MRNGIVGTRHENVQRDEYPDSVLDAHRNDKEHQNHPIREKPSISDKNSHQRARSPDDKGHRRHRTEQIERNAEKPGKDRAENIKNPKTAKSNRHSDIIPEHPEREHIESKMPEIHMDERVCQITPRLLISDRH